MYFVDEALDDIKPIKDLLNNPRLIDKFSIMVSLSGSDIKACTPEIGSSQYYDNPEILRMTSDEYKVYLAAVLYCELFTLCIRRYVIEVSTYWMLFSYSLIGFNYKK